MEGTSYTGSTFAWGNAFFRSASRWARRCSCSRFFLEEMRVERRPTIAAREAAAAAADGAAVGDIKLEGGGRSNDRADGFGGTEGTLTLRRIFRRFGFDPPLTIFSVSDASMSLTDADVSGSDFLA